jgi:hypothetical protein
MSDEPVANPFAEVFVSLMAGCVAFWRALTGGATGNAVSARSERGTARQTEPSA